MTLLHTQCSQHLHTFYTMYGVKLIIFYLEVCSRLFVFAFKYEAILNALSHKKVDMGKTKHIHKAEIII